MSLSDKLLGKLFVGQDISIDLGTSNTRIYARGKGIVISEPSVVAINSSSHRIIAVGYEAEQMVGRTPRGIITVKPLKGGVSSDFDITEKMLHFFIERTLGRRPMARPQVVVSVPADTTVVEQKAVVDACIQAGARRVFLIEEPIAAAIGAQLPIHEPMGNMIVDIGAGTTEAVVISLGGIVVCESTRVGGNTFDCEIVNYLKKYHRLAVGEQTAEALKIKIGSVLECPPVIRKCEVTGIDLLSGLPAPVVITSEDLRFSIEDSVARIIKTVKSALDKTPPELSVDVLERGITLTGGGALISGMRERVQNETGLPVSLAEAPLLSVARGGGKCLEDLDGMKDLVTSFAT